MSSYAHIPHPDDWATKNGLGNCFHQVLSRWAWLRDDGDTRWKIAVGVVSPLINLGHDRHIHAWLQHGDQVSLAVDGSLQQRDAYYQFMGVERDSVRLVNPRQLLREHRVIDRAAIGALLQLWGQPWHVNDLGGIMPGHK